MGQKYKKLLGIKDETEWMTIAPEKIYKAFGEFWPTLKDSGDFAVPMVDGYFLPMDETKAVACGNYHKIPYMISTTSEDIMPELLHAMAVEYAGNIEEQSHLKGYVYYFSRQLPGDDAGAWHSADLWYVFGTLNRSWRPFDDWDRKLSNSMCTYISNFVRTGNPNSYEESLTEWKECTKDKPYTMCFGDDLIECCIMPGKVNIKEI